MKNDGKPFLAIILCLLVYVGYMKYIETKYPDYGKTDKGSEDIQTDSGPDQLVKNYLKIKCSLLSIQLVEN